MTLNSKTRKLINVGSILKDYSHTYTVTLLDKQAAGRHIYITTKADDGQTLYYMPISFYYGTTILNWFGFELI